MTANKLIATLAEWMLSSHYTTVLTGAGMSTESGIPDFRSQQGLWEKYDPSYVSSLDAFNRHHELFHHFYSLRIEDIRRLSPHEGYAALNRMEKNGYIKAIATQNVDGFHKRSGSFHTLELHGSLNRIYCHSCSKDSHQMAFINKETCACGGKLRPDIVFFGEMLPQDIWQKALSSIEQSDLILVIGTSLQVYPVNQLPTMTKGKIVWINREPSVNHIPFDLSIQGSAKEIIIDLEKELAKNSQ